jgi:hypothetical protein
MQTEFPVILFLPQMHSYAGGDLQQFAVACDAAKGKPLYQPHVSHLHGHMHVHEGCAWFP